MKNSLYLFIVCICLFFSYCKSKKAKFGEGDKVKIKDLIEFYEEKKLPIEITDSIFFRKNTDTINYKIFTQFVPDSVLTGVFHKTKPLFLPLGKVTVKDGETYLFTKATTTSKKAVYITVFDQKQNFVTAMPLIVADNDKTTSSIASMDSKYALTTINRQTRSNAEAAYEKNVYVYNTAGVFTLILTESAGVDKKPDEVINPIDTLPAKNKLAGDYIQNKRNFISFRDGRGPSKMLFFVHFEKESGDCKGELKGEAKIISEKLIRYSEVGSPCVIDFTFYGKTVTMKEVGGCGSYRNIKCFFEGTYTKKVPAKKVKTKK